MDTKEVLADEDIVGMKSRDLHRPFLDGAARNVKTTFWYEAAPAASPGPEVQQVNALAYDMSEFFHSCISLYANLTGSNPEKYPRVPTPFGNEDVHIFENENV